MRDIVLADFLSKGVLVNKEFPCNVVGVLFGRMKVFISLQVECVKHVIKLID